MHGRMQRHDTVPEHLGEPGELLDRRHGEPCVGEEARGAAARDELDAEPVEPFRERGQARLVPRGQERPRVIAMSSLTTSGSSRCSTAWIRACRVSGVSPGSTGTGSWRSTGPVSIPSSTRCTVAPVSRDAGGERVLDRGGRPGTQAGAPGARSRRCPGKQLEEAGREQMHVACADNEIDTVRSRASRAMSASRVSRSRIAGQRGTRRSGGPRPRPARARERRDVGGDRGDGRPASSSAWRFVPSPLASTPYASPHATPVHPGLDASDHEVARRSIAGAGTTAQ